MRFIVMFVTAVCVLFLIKLRWPKKKNFYQTPIVVVVVVVVFFFAWSRYERKLYH